ncbi:MAG: isoprenylcysteine carboxyl methyltransferase family protein [Egibacteraceae bacterium]
MTSQTLFTLLVLAVGGVRLIELAVSARHSRWARARGGVEYGRGHYPALIAVHVGLFAGMLIEVQVAARPFLPVLGWPMLALVLASHALLWWCIRTLGPRWNTRVIVIPGMPLVASGPYRWLRHPNYAAVVVEGVALPLVHTAWLTALAFTLVNGVVLAVRIRVENAALALASP